MTIKVTCNEGKSKSKELANALAKVLGAIPAYKGSPRHKYAVGDVFAEAGGIITFPDSTDIGRVKRVLAALEEHGYSCVDDTLEAPISTVSVPESLTIEVPLDGFSEAAIANLEKLTASKKTILKKALNTEALPIERCESTLRFPWFTLPTVEAEAEAETIKTYTILVTKMCDMAKRQKNISAKETSAENPKWAMRTFLLRLGFVGDEYKTARRILTQGLEGDGAFRNGRPTHKNVTQI